VATTTSSSSAGCLARHGAHRAGLVVRAREVSPLHALPEVAPTLTRTVVYSDFDYRCRARLGREEWAQALAELGATCPIQTLER
jgi:hypothetical protein